MHSSYSLSQLSMESHRSLSDGSDEGNPGGACFRLETESCYRRARGFHRRELCAGEKGGLKVEVKLATSTLVQMVVPDAPGAIESASQFWAKEVWLIGLIGGTFADSPEV